MPTTPRGYPFPDPDDPAELFTMRQDFEDLATAVDDDVTDSLAALSGTYVARSLIDAAGDLLVGTADNTLGRLAQGTALQGLRVNAAGTGLEWATASRTPSTGEGYVAASESTTSSTYVDLTTPLTASFVVPPSQLCLFYVGGFIANSTGGTSVMSYQIFDVDVGGLNSAADDAYAAMTVGTAGQQVAFLSLRGFAAGEVGRNMRAEARYRSNSGTATFARRRLGVIPL